MLTKSNWQPTYQRDCWVSQFHNPHDMWQKCNHFNVTVKYVVLLNRQPDVSDIGSRRIRCYTKYSLTGHHHCLGQQLIHIGLLDRRASCTLSIHHSEICFPSPIQIRLWLLALHSGCQASGKSQGLRPAYYRRVDSSSPVNSQRRGCYGRLYLKWNEWGPKRNETR